MNVVAHDWLPYRLPLTRPWQTSNGLSSVRQGRLLRLITDDGLTGWGDCAPLPEFGISEACATSFAEETAYLDLASQRARLPLNSWLSDCAPTASVAVNANLGIIFNITERLIAATLRSGFLILKAKVGVGHWQDEIHCLQRLSRHLPAGVQLRLDANAAWTISDAESFLAACNELPIEGLEEPLRNPTQQALLRLQNSVNFPLAVDESIHLVDRSFFDQPPVRRLILKPARHGGILPTMGIALRAQASGIECIVTSSLESNCGLLACAQLAATIAPLGTHGLGTAAWFIKNTGETLKQNAGRVILPSIPGLGFYPNPAQATNETV